jgi:hypothetical protein
MTLMVNKEGMVTKIGFIKPGVFPLMILGNRRVCGFEGVENLALSYQVSLRERCSFHWSWQHRRKIGGLLLAGRASNHRNDIQMDFFNNLGFLS